MKFYKKIEPVSLEELLKKKDYFVYSYKFPDNTIFVRQTYSLDCLDFLHYSFGRKNGNCEPICVARRTYPNVYPQVELNLKSPTTVEELNIAKRKVLGLYSNMRVLNKKVEVWGVQPPRCNPHHTNIII